MALTVVPTPATEIVESPSHSRSRRGPNRESHRRQGHRDCRFGGKAQSRQEFRSRLRHQLQQRRVAEGGHEDHARPRRRRRLRPGRHDRPVAQVHRLERPLDHRRVRCRLDREGGLSFGVRPFKDWVPSSAWRKAEMSVSPTVRSPLTKLIPRCRFRQTCSCLKT